MQRIEIFGANLWIFKQQNKIVVFFFLFLIAQINFDPCKRLSNEWWTEWQLRFKKVTSILSNCHEDDIKFYNSIYKRLIRLELSWIAFELSCIETLIRLELRAERCFCAIEFMKLVLFVFFFFWEMFDWIVWKPYSPIFIVALEFRLWLSKDKWLHYFDHLYQLLWCFRHIKPQILFGIVCVANV